MRTVCVTEEYIARFYYCICCSFSYKWLVDEMGFFKQRNQHILCYGYMVMDHSASERGNSLPPLHRLL